MVYNLVHPLNYNQNEAQNMVLHNLVSLPASGVAGQVLYNSASGQNKPYYYNGTSWQPFEGVDTYVSSAAFNTSTGGLTLTKSDATTVTVNLDGRYLTGNQNITLSGDVSGTGATAITTTIQPTAITNKADATLGTNSGPAGTSYMLIAQDGVLKRYSFSSLQSYVGSIIGTSGYVNSYTVTAQTVAGGANIQHFLQTGAGAYTQNIEILGTANEVEVSQTGGKIYVGLPDNVTTTGNLTVGGNLTVNGTVTTVNTETINLADNIITLNSNYTGSAPTENAGFEVERGTLTNTSLIWNELTDRWQFSNDGATFYNIPVPSEYTAYSHPTQAAISIDGAGLQFVQDITVNTLGHVTAVSLGNIPTATSTQQGVIELADSAELTAGNSDTVVPTVGGVTTMISDALSTIGATNKYVATINPANGSTTIVPHTLGTEDVNAVIFNAATKEVVLAPWKITGLNTIEVAVGNNPIGSLLVKVYKM